MKILLYSDLNIKPVEKQVQKALDHLKKGDFRSADVKKMVNTGYFRAKLDERNRLLFKFAKYKGETHILILEVILNHEYDKSRFLHLSEPNEDNFVPLYDASMVEQLPETQPLVYVNPKSKYFYLLDKALSFDEAQEAVYQVHPPIIIIGSAGSGKTALTLEKVKQLQGEILYVTLSPYLVENASLLYRSYGYENEKQEVSFLSFKELLETIQIPEGKEITYNKFSAWFTKHSQMVKTKDSHKVYEEFKGVMTGMKVDKPYLSRQDYLALGVKQSVFLDSERNAVYDLFEKYLSFLKSEMLYDTNMLSYQYLGKVLPTFDYVVVDEVQDLTNAQLNLILKCLRTKGHFILCGDSNQIVHPNFFSWANVKTMFYHQEIEGEIIRILAANYRNTPEVTEISNKLLLLKNLRFGSIDKESTYLIEASSNRKGEVLYLEDHPKVKGELNQKTKHSTKFAVIVMREEDKLEAKRYFQTPLVFSVQEAKGLEYENIIIYNIISSNEKSFRDICEGINQDDMKKDLTYGRGRDKTDKSLEIYKFFVNSLYVAMTRAISNLYFVESAGKHPLLNLLGLMQYQHQLNIKEQKSTNEEWQKEAHRLEMQGKKEQADAIRKQILKTVEAPWEPMTYKTFVETQKSALDPQVFNKKAKHAVFEFALIHKEYYILPKLAKLNYKPAAELQKRKQEETKLFNQVYDPYKKDKFESIQVSLGKYGIDFRNEFNKTPLMLAVESNAEQIVRRLLDLGANKSLLDNFGANPLQICLRNAFFDPSIAKSFLPNVYDALRTDSIKVRYNDKLIKVGDHLMEYFLFNFMMGTLRSTILGVTTTRIPAFKTDDVLRIVHNLPASIMPARRKERTYISSILSKNEVSRNDKYNKFLFFRVRQGFYVINPLLQVQVGEVWKNVYDLIEIDLLPERSNIYTETTIVDNISTRAIKRVRQTNSFDEQDNEIENGQ